MRVRVSVQLDPEGRDGEFCKNAARAAYYIRRDENGARLLGRLANGAPMNVNGLSNIAGALGDARFNYESMAANQGYDVSGTARREEYLRRADLIVDVSQEVEILLDEMQSIEQGVNKPETYNELVCAL